MRRVEKPKPIDSDVRVYEENSTGANAVAVCEAVKMIDGTKQSPSKVARFKIKRK